MRSISSVVSGQTHQDRVEQLHAEGLGRHKMRPAAAMLMCLSSRSCARLAMTAMSIGGNVLAHKRDDHRDNVLGDAHDVAAWLPGKASRQRHGPGRGFECEVRETTVM